MSKSTPSPFEIDLKNKTFVFSHKNYQALFVEGSPVNVAFHAAMNLGCYSGFVPVEAPQERIEKNTVTQQWTEKGVLSFIETTCPEYLPRWELMKKARNASNKPFMFMVRKNLFLYENAEARKFCRVIDTADKPYKLLPNGETLRSIVDKMEAQGGEKPAATSKK